MKTATANYLSVVVAFILLVTGLFYFAWERYSEGDIDATGAYVCMVSMIACIAPISIKDISFARKVVIGIGIVNIILLFILWCEEGFSLIGDGLHVFIMMPAIAIVYVGLYVSMIKKGKKLLRDKEMKQKQ